MTDTTRLIKKHIEEKYGSPARIEIGNCSEINFSLKGKTVYQYIIV